MPNFESYCRCPGCGECKAHANEAALRAKLATAERERDAAIRGLNAVEALINESYGVAGLHLNGDVAPWSDLRTGGRYEPWLLAFDAAIAGKGAV